MIDPCCWVKKNHPLFERFAVLRWLIYGPVKSLWAISLPIEDNYLSGDLIGSTVKTTSPSVWKDLWRIYKSRYRSVYEMYANNNKKNRLLGFSALIFCELHWIVIGGDIMRRSFHFRVVAENLSSVRRKLIKYLLFVSNRLPLSWE